MAFSCKIGDSLLPHNDVMKDVYFKLHYLPYNDIPYTAQSSFVHCLNLPSNGIEERGVLGVGSIPVAITLSCQDMKHIALY